MIEKTLPKILPVARVTICLFLRYDKVRHPLLYYNILYKWHKTKMFLYCLVVEASE